MDSPQQTCPHGIPLSWGCIVCHEVSAPDDTEAPPITAAEIEMECAGFAESLETEFEEALESGAFSSRVSNALKHASITNLQGMVDFGRANFLRERNISAKSVKMIDDWVGKTYRGLVTLWNRVEH